MKKHARENLRKRRNRHQKEQIAAGKAYQAAKAAAAPIVAASPPAQPQVRREPLVVTLHSDPLADLIDDAVAGFGLGGLMIVMGARGSSFSSRRLSSPDVLEAEPGSFRELVEKINK